MSDLQKIAKRIMRMIEAGETGQDVFARDAGTLAELILNIEEYNGLIFQDKFFTNFVSYFRLFFKLHFANNLGIHSSVFDNRYLNETFDNYIYSCNFQYRL